MRRTAESVLLLRDFAIIAGLMTSVFELCWPRLRGPLPHDIYIYNAIAIGHSQCAVSCLHSPVFLFNSGLIQLIIGLQGLRIWEGKGNRHWDIKPETRSCQYYVFYTSKINLEGIKIPNTITDI